MADQIRVDWEQMEAVAGQLLRLAGDLDSIRSRIRNVHISPKSGSELHISLSAGKLVSTGQGLPTGTVEDCLRNLAAVTTTLRHYTSEKAHGVKEAAQAFANNERTLALQFEGLLTPESLMLGVGQAFGYGGNMDAWSPQMQQKILDLLKNAQVITEGGLTFITTDGHSFLIGAGGLIGHYQVQAGLSGITSTTTLFLGDGQAETTLQLGLLDGISFKDSFLKPHSLDKFEGQYNTETGEFSEGVPEGTALGLLSIGAMIGTSISAWHQSASYQGEHLSASATAGLGNAEAHATVQGGLGVFLPDGNGNNQLYLGISGEVGASVSAVNVEGSLEYELCDNVSLGVEGDMSLFSAEAGAQAGLGIIAGEPMLYAEASAEANLVEANVSGSLDLGLVEGTVGAGVTVGVGAHAEVGYHDGVLSFDIGASLGFGASINASLDIGGAVDATGEAIGSVINAAGDVFSGAADVAGDAFAAAGDAVSGAYNFVADGVSSVADGFVDFLFG